MLRLFGEPEANARAFDGARALPRPARRGRRRGDGPARARPARALVPAQAPLALGLPAARHGVRRVRRARRPRRLLARAPAAPSARATRAGSFALSPEGLAGIEQLLSTPLADAAAAGLGDRARARGARGRHLLLRGARRLPAAHALRMRRELGDGYELDDDPGRIDVAAVHRYLSEESYWAAGRPYELQERARPRRVARRRPLPRRARRSASAGRSRPSACRPSTSRTSTSSPSTAGAASGRRSSRR